MTNFSLNLSAFSKLLILYKCVDFIAHAYCSIHNRFVLLFRLSHLFLRTHICIAISLMTIVRVIEKKYTVFEFVMMCFNTTVLYCGEFAWPLVVFV